MILNNVNDKNTFVRETYIFDVNGKTYLFQKYIYFWKKKIPIYMEKHISAIYNLCHAQCTKNSTFTCTIAISIFLHNVFDFSMTVKTFNFLLLFVLRCVLSRAGMTLGIFFTWK